MCSRLRGAFSMLETRSPSSAPSLPTHTRVEQLSAYHDPEDIQKYRTEIAHVLGTSPEDRLCIEYRAGISTIITRLRHQDRETLHRLLHMTDRRVQRFLLSSFLMEEWWNVCAQSTPSFLANVSVPEDMRYSDRISLLQSETSVFLKEQVQFWLQGEQPAFTQEVLHAQESILFYTPFSSVTGHLEAGIKTGSFYPWELLRILPRVLRAHRNRALTSADREDCEQLAQSIPRLLSLLARLYISTFTTITRAAADAPAPPQPQANFTPRAHHFWIRETSGTLQLELDEQVLATAEGHSAPGIGCPAIHARDEQKKEVNTALFRRIVFPLWNAHCLERVLDFPY